jgi:hypothetical protein
MDTPSLKKVSLRKDLESFGFKVLNIIILNNKKKQSNLMCFHIVTNEQSEIIICFRNVEDDLITDDDIVLESIHNVNVILNDIGEKFRFLSKVYNPVTKKRHGIMIFNHMGMQAFGKTTNQAYLFQDPEDSRKMGLDIFNYNYIPYIIQQSPTINNKELRDLSMLQLHAHMKIVEESMDRFNSSMQIGRKISDQIKKKLDLSNQNLENKESNETINLSDEEKNKKIASFIYDVGLAIEKNIHELKQLCKNIK